MRKVLCLLYNYSTPDNKEITDPDINKFLTDLIDNSIGEIGLRPHTISNNADLLLKLKAAIKDTSISELYLHISSHGFKTGMDFGEWDVSIDNFKTLLNSSKIKFCFFSACSSSEIAEAVSENVPVTLGSSYKIGNNFAIEFQKEFYHSLIKEKKSFKQAFDLALLQLKNNEEIRKIIQNQQLEKGHVLLRSSFGDTGNKGVPDDLHLLYKEEKYLDRYMRKPNLADLLSNRATSRDILVHWTDDPNKVDLESALIKKGLDELIQNFPLDNNPFEELAEPHIIEQLSMADYKFKFCFCISKATFPKQLTAFIEKDLYSLESIFDFRIFLINNNQIITFPESVQKILGPQKWSSHNFINEQELLDSDDFYSFIKPGKEALSVKRSLIFEVPFSPSKDNLLDNTAERLHLFLINPRNEIVVEYLINYHKQFEEYMDPIILVDTQINQGADLISSFQTSVIQELNDKLEEHKRGLMSILFHFIDHPKIVYIPIAPHYSKDDLKTFIASLRTELNGATKIYKDVHGQLPNKKETLFFITTSILTDQELSAISGTNVSVIINPTDIDEAIIVEWSRRMNRSKKNLVNIAKEEYHFGKKEYKCPSKFLRHSCQRLEVPGKSIIKI